MRRRTVVAATLRKVVEMANVREEEEGGKCAHPQELI